MLRWRLISSTNETIRSCLSSRSPPSSFKRSLNSDLTNSTSSSCCRRIVMPPEGCTRLLSINLFVFSAKFSNSRSSSSESRFRVEQACMTSHLCPASDLFFPFSFISSNRAAYCSRIASSFSLYMALLSYPNIGSKYSKSTYI